MEIFLELDYGLERINGGLSKDTYLAKLELEDGTMIIQDSSGKLYQLDKEAAEQLNKLIN